MRTLGAIALLLFLTLPARAADPQSDDQKAFYALGVGISKQLVQLQPLTPDEVNFIATGLTAGPHQVAVRATDARGNRSTQTTLVTVGNATADAKR